MADRKPSDDKAAFGVFPQMRGKRSKQDPEAAKNVPVDLARGFVAGALGMPGDVESLVRLPYELITGNESPTFLPTSEDIEKRLPFRSDTPVSRAASGLGILSGGFYTGPGSGARAITAVPKAVKRAGLDFAQSISPVNVIKPKGGNFLTGSVEGALKGLKRNTAAGNDPAEMLNRMRERYTPEEIAKLQEGTMKQHVLDSITDLEKDVALNNWVERNLTNYVKRDMATPEDPVRRLADQGIVHVSPDEVGMNRYRAGAHRSTFGGQREGISEAARAWEDSADVAISPYTVGEIKKAKETGGPLSGLYEPWMDKADEATEIYKASKELHPNYLGFDHIMDVLRQDVASGRIRPDQLNKVSMEQAVRRTYEFDQEMAKKMREAAIKQQEGFPVYKEYPEGYRWIELTTPKNMKLPEGYSVKPDPITNRKTGVVDTNSYRLVDKEGKAVGWGKTEEEAISSGLGEQVLKDALKYEGDTMGHCVGGYCPDVLEGRSRIFSLRDAKGEPHVTIETSPQVDYEQAARLMGVDDPTKGDIARLVAEGRLPSTEKIVQIKGKQNARPISKYDPFTQDFVKSGQWSEVRDLQNTGLRRRDTPEGVKYMNDAEYSDDLLRELGMPPEEGMKRGGVVVSNNPDTMMLELNNHKMAGGGLLKGLAKAVKGTKAPQDKALSLAQQRAALPVEQGGLGLPANNTPEQRAKAMGYIDYLHGTQRMDRLLEGKTLNPRRATSGPMPYGTTTPELASSYATSKADTSRRAMDEGDVRRYFEVAPKDIGVQGFRTPIPVEQAWNFMSPEQKARISNLAPRVGYEDLDQFTGEFIVHPEGVNATLSPSQWDWFMKNEARGNPLTALRNMWYESGQLVDEPEKLGEIYRLAGIEAPISQTNAPWTEAQGVLLGKARITNPIDTSNTEQIAALIEPLKQAFAKDRSRTKAGGPDQWAKDSRYTPKSWVSELEKDIADNKESYVWTSIPDKVTQELIRLGFNGIIDRSGKGGGAKEPVVIPFTPEQVRSRFAAFDPFRKTAATAAAMGVAAPDLLAEEASKERVQISDDPQVMELEINKAKGGAVHMQVGGIVNSLAKTEALAKLAKLREEMATRSEAVKNLTAKDENKYLSDVTPNSLTKAEIEAEIARMKARVQPEVKKADGGAIDFNTTPDTSDKGRIMEGAPFKHGGKVKMTANRDAMFLELSNKKLKRK